MEREIFLAYLMCVEPFIAMRNKIGCLRNFSCTIKRHEELNVLLPFSPNVKVQQDQGEKIAVMGFLVAFPFEYDFVRAHILSSLEVSFFQETFSQIPGTKISSYAHSSTQMSSALVGRNSDESGKSQCRNSGLGGNTRGPNSRGVVCYYCCKLGHVIRDCKKLQNRNQRFRSAHIASSNEASDQSVQFSAKLARFHLYQESLKSPSTSVTTIDESGNPNTCLISSLSSE